MSGIGHDRHMTRIHNEGVPALYPGLCTRCDEQWRIGDPIVKRGTRWYHAACGRTDDE